MRHLAAAAQTEGLTAWRVSAVRAAAARWPQSRGLDFFSRLSRSNVRYFWPGAWRNPSYMQCSHMPFFRFVNYLSPEPVQGGLEPLLALWPPRPCGVSLLPSPPCPGQGLPRVKPPSWPDACSPPWSARCPAGAPPCPSAGRGPRRWAGRASCPGSPWRTRRSGGRGGSSGPWRLRWTLQHRKALLKHGR